MVGDAWNGRKHLRNAIGCIGGRSIVENHHRIGCVTPRIILRPGGDPFERVVLAHREQDATAGKPLDKARRDFGLEPVRPEHDLDGLRTGRDAPKSGYRR